MRLTEMTDNFQKRFILTIQHRRRPYEFINYSHLPYVIHILSTKELYQA
jgi:hypothetical protein